MNQVKESWRACRSPRTISIPQSARCLEKCRLPFPEREEEQELCAAIRSGRVPAVVDGGMPCGREPKLPDGGIDGGLSELTPYKKSTAGT
jgi:hypothetical protein